MFVSSLINIHLAEDCYLNTITCQADQYCFSERSETKLSQYDRKEPMISYKMGCKHSPLCRQIRTFGYGPFGYSEIFHSCCCKSLCTKFDYNNKINFDNCSREEYAFGANTNSSSDVCSLRLYLFPLFYVMHFLNELGKLSM